VSGRAAAPRPIVPKRVASSRRVTPRRVALRRPAQRLGDDRGATAVITAVVATALFAAGALAVDLGNVYAREARVEAVVDQVAVAAAGGLPDPCGAVRAAAESLVADGNAVLDDVPGEDVDTWEHMAQHLTDATAGNGDIEILGPDGTDVTPVFGAGGAALDPADCTEVGTRVRVVAPAATVAVGLAAAIGVEPIEVVAAAGAALVAPLPVLPLAIPEECAADGPRTYVVAPEEPVVLPEAADGSAFTPPGVATTLLGVVIQPTLDDGRLVADVSLFPPTFDGARTGAWVADFRSVRDGTPVQVPGVFASGVLTGNPLAAEVRLPVPEEVLEAGGSWRVRIGRQAQPGDAPVAPFTDALGMTRTVAWGAGTAVLVVSTPAAPPQACDPAGLYGDVLLVEQPDPRGTAANGMTGAVPVGDTVVLAGAVQQRARAGDVSSGLLSRLSASAPPCPAGPLLDRPDWTVAGLTITATNGAECYGTIEGTAPDLRWRFADPALVEDPRFFVVPVVDLSSVLPDLRFPQTPVTVTVTGYRIGFVTDETPGLALPVCSTLECTGISVSDPSGPVDRLRIHSLDPALLELAGTVRLRDNGHPWLTGPLPSTAPRDVHLTE